MPAQDSTVGDEGPRRRDFATAADHLRWYLGPEGFADLLELSVRNCRAIDAAERLSPSQRAVQYRNAATKPARFTAD